MLPNITFNALDILSYFNIFAKINGLTNSVLNLKFETFY